MFKVEASIYWSEIDAAYIVGVPKLSGCTADGESYAEVMANTEIVIGEWIETALALGRSIPEPKGRPVFA